MTPVDERLEDFATRLRSLERELEELRRLAGEEQAPPVPQETPELWELLQAPPVVPPPTPEPAPAPAPPPRIFETPPRPARPAPAAPPAPAPPPVAPPRTPRREIDWSFLLGARALAWTGGAVTLLGIVFFFVLSVQRGWIGPSMRVALGAAASALVFGAGVWMRRNNGGAYSAYAAVGAGIAGAYATLLSASALYELVPGPLALVFAGVIAAVGVATSLAWRSETIAGLGLVGSMLVPLAVVVEGGVSALGTAFVGLVLAATLAVGVHRRWTKLVAVGVLASAPQIGLLMLDADGRDGRVLALAVAFWLLYAAAGVASHLRGADRSLGRDAATLLVFSAVFAANACAALFDGDATGWALLAAGAAYAAASAFFFRSERDLSALVTALALAVGGIAFAQLLGGGALTVAWAAEAAVLAWLARRVREIRFQLASLVWLALAATHALALDAPPRDLFVESVHAAGGALGAFAVAIAAAVAARYAFAWDAPAPQRGILRPLNAAIDGLRRRQDVVRVVAFALSGAFALYAASLAILGAATRIGGDVGTAFDWGHTAVAALWAVAGLGAVAAGTRRGSRRLTIAGYVTGAAAVALVLGYDLESVGQTPRAWAFAAVAAAIFAASLLGRDDENAPVLALATSLVLGGAAAAWLLDGTWLTLAWAIETSVLALLARRFALLRLDFAAILWLAVTAAHVFAFDAPQDDFFQASSDPGEGVPAVLLLAAAGVAVAFFSRERTLRRAAAISAAASTVYAASLGVLAAGVELASFDWGQVGVACLWSALGVAAVLAGRRTTSLVFGGAMLLLAAYDGDALAQEPRSWALLALGGGAVAIGFFVARDRLEWPAVVGTAASVALAAGGLAGLLGGAALGFALLGAAAVYAAFAAPVFRTNRDLSTLLWATALAVAAPATLLVVQGTWVVLAWAAAAAALAFAARALAEDRLEVASLAYLGLALAWTICVEALPHEVFVVHANPGAGAPAAALVAGAAAAYVRFASRRRVDVAWLGGTLAVYAATLALLELFQHLGDPGLDTAFQRGHTAVSALWGSVGLALLYVGLRRRVRGLQLGGFALFGVSLAKLFVYDLTFLSSVARAFSFLAVGGVLLVAGFLYQRLAVDSRA